MTFTDAIKSCVGKYATFKGRAPRSEYWWFNLFYVLVSMCMHAAFMGIGMGIGGLAGLYVALNICSLLTVLVFFLPLLAVTVRRLHDIGRSAWWLLLCYVPLLLVLVLALCMMLLPNVSMLMVLYSAIFMVIVGCVVLLVFMLLGSDDENKYGLPVY